MRHGCIGGLSLQRIPKFYAHLQDPMSVCSESGTTDVYRRLPLLPKQVGDPCHLGTIPASNGADKQRARLGARDKPKRQGAKEQTLHAHKPASLDCSFALSLLVPYPVSHTSVYLMYVSTYLNIYIYIYDWCSMESLCRKVAASLLAHKPFFPPPLIIFYWNFGGVFQLPTIVRSLQVAWLGRARSNAKRTESLGHHPVGRRVAN